MRATTTIPTLLVLLVAAVAPASAASTPHSRGHWGEEHAVRVLLGEFEPRGESQYFTDKTFDFTGDADDLSDVAVGFEYLRFLNERMGFVAGMRIFTGETTQSYLDFVDDAGFDIFHDTELEVASFTVGLLFHLVRRDRPIVPYLGAGGGLYTWRLTETGDFIDFGAADPEIFFDTFEEDGETFGWYWQAGLEVPLGRNLSVFGDARWSRADADLEGAFSGLGDLDLSGRTLSAGVTFSF